MEKLRVLSLFSGVGAFEKALENLGIDHEVIGYCEIDRWAAKAYSVIHGIPELMNYGDVTKINVDELPEFDLVTYGFPCQDISVAGKQAGINEGTRSGLVTYPLKFIAAKKPKYAICENVKNLVGKKFKADFDGILADLESMGYTNHWKVLNSKNHGVPQNRERLFLVSIRNDLDTSYTFPEGYDNGVRLRDILEPVVDERHYIDDAKTAKLINELSLKPGDSVNLKMKNPQIRRDGLNCTLTSSMCNEPPKVCIDMLGLLDIKGNEQVRRVYGVDGVAPTLNTMGGGNRQPKVLVETDGIHCINPRKADGSQTYQQDRVYTTDGHMVALSSQLNGRFNIVETVPRWRIRKLTPLECFRLQAFDDNDHDALVNAGISNSQMYRVAGNSITVTVLMDIFKALLCRVPQHEVLCPTTTHYDTQN